MHRLMRLQTRLQPHHLSFIHTLLLMVSAFVIFTSSQVFADIRLLNRSVFIYNPTPSATTKYTISFTYNSTSQPIGSIDMLFCYDPIPNDPCTAPPGLNAAAASLIDQTGETGYHISTHTANHIVLSRPPATVGQTPSTYTFDNIVNPKDLGVPFSIRLSDYADSNATPPAIDVGSVISTVTKGILIDTQVPGMLMFCVAEQVSDDCTSTSGVNYSNMGTISSSHTLIATSQMAAGTNASSGYVITVNGPPMEAGTNVINPLSTPTPSAPGNTQFGINLRSNSVPNVGSDPDGSFANANPTANYDVPNKFTYNDGDVVASAPNVSLIRRFTVTYILNAAPNLRAGVYTTTLTYICTGRF